MRTTTLILGLIAATMLLFGGCAGFVFGTAATTFEEAFEIEENDDGTTSTSSDVQSAGAFAIVSAIFLYVGGGLARVALKTSLGFLVVSLLLIFGLVSTDTTSLFAAFYYLALILVGVCIILMIIAFTRERRANSETAAS